MTDDPLGYPSLAARLVRDGEDLRLDIPETWMQGRTAYGGLTAALCLEGCLATLGDLPPLRSALVSFVGPAAGTARIASSILRRGRSVTFASADLYAEDRVATRAEFAFGAGRDSRFDVRWLTAPPAPPPEACEVYIPDGLGPAFARHFESRLAAGGRPVSNAAEPGHTIWVRHKDPKAEGPAALLALADMPPPSVMPMFDAFAPISSMTWMVNFLTATPTTRDGWWLLHTDAEDAAEGYSSQNMLIFDRDGRPVCAGRQSVAVFV